MSQGKAIIFTAPSGSGKTTIVKHLLKVYPELSFSISATTRQKRETETHAKDYYFLSQEDFQTKIENNAFVEWEEFYGGSRYGTLKEEVERIWAEGKHVVFDVEVKGATSLKEYFGDKALAVFVKVPSLEILKERLIGRGTESEDTMAKRLGRAEFEMSFEEKFDVTLVNEELESSFEKAEKIISAFIKS